MPDLGNPKDRWLPFLLFCGCLGFVVYIFVSRDQADAGLLIAGAAMFAFFAGALFMMWTRREP